MKVKMFWALALVGLLGGIAASGYWYVASPAYAIRQIRTSLEEHNRLKFQRYVDVDALAGSLVDGVMGQSVVQAGEPQNPFAQLGAAMGAAMLSNMKPALVTQIRTGILDGVESGRMDRVFTPKDTGVSSQTLVAYRVAADPSMFIGMGELQREGQLALIGLRFRNTYLDTVLTMRLRMEKLESGWRVTGIEDLAGYLASVEQLQGKRLAMINGEQRRRIMSGLKAGSLQRRAWESSYYDEHVRIDLSFTNTGGDTIETAVARLIGVEDLEPTRSDGWLLNLGRVAPGQSGRMTRTIDYNRFIDWHRSLRYGDDITAEVFWVVRRSGARRDTIRLYPNWSEYMDATR